ncbi:formylmethanofuran--tetrahydromethanopterin N-formyltransferase [Planctomicrobium sp.]|nr:formylmethanofuran--tetrahydromethanopterin N-formyltransferase [Planctomicrobium sp.]MDB4743744.1 formylmethanofuran--tetrahydromethanopterin N-formyltransferase [Planctomicrobium sp.]
MADSFELNGVEIANTFAEAFAMKGSRIIITAANEKWAGIAAMEMSGYATSVIACDAEVAVERTLEADETPDGRVGVSVLAFGFDRDSLANAIQGRVGQCVLTTPTTACFNGIEDCPKDKRIQIGGAIRFFGDGLQFSKKLGTRRFWRLPVMDGEFLCEDRFGTVTGVGGGNLIICGTTQAQTLNATEAAVAAMQEVPDIILPFPGGIVRSGSKVGSQYKKLKASTNEAYCPTVRPLAESDIPDGCNAVYEIVIDGLSPEAVQAAMKAGLHAAAGSEGILKITAGNYGGKLGKHHFYLRELL